MRSMAPRSTTRSMADQATTSVWLQWRRPAFGDSGDDKISGADSDDTINGGFDDDVCNGDAGDDVVIGGIGSDVVRGSARQ